MAVKIRLARTGAKKAPYYRIVVADSRARRDGRFIEILGRYNPRMQPSVVELDVEKTREWIGKGAQMTETVEKLLAIAEGTKEAPVAEEKLSKKAVAKAEADAKAAEAAAAAPAPVAESSRRRARRRGCRRRARRRSSRRGARRRRSLSPKRLPPRSPSPKSLRPRTRLSPRRLPPRSLSPKRLPPRPPRTSSTGCSPKATWKASCATW